MKEIAQITLALMAVVCAAWVLGVLVARWHELLKLRRQKREAEEAEIVRQIDRVIQESIRHEKNL